MAEIPAEDREGRGRNLLPGREPPESLRGSHSLFLPVWDQSMWRLAGNKLSRKLILNVSEMAIPIPNAPNIHIKEYDTLNGNQSLNLTPFLSFTLGQVRFNKTLQLYTTVYITLNYAAG